MNNREFYEQIMWNVSREVKKALNEEYMNNDEILNHYGITLFQMNEGININFQKYKEGVVNAIKKLQAKMGDKAGYFIKDLIDAAKKTNVKTLVLVLSMLCAFAGSTNAHMTNKAQQGFADDCAKYCMNDSTLNNAGQKHDNFINVQYENYQYMCQDADFVYYSGYGQGNNFKEAKSIATRDAMKKMREDGNESTPNEFFQTQIITGANPNQCLVIIKIIRQR